MAAGRQRLAAAAAAGVRAAGRTPHEAGAGGGGGGLEAADARRPRRRRRPHRLGRGEAARPSRHSGGRAPPSLTASGGPPRSAASVGPARKGGGRVSSASRWVLGGVDFGGSAPSRAFPVEEAVAVHCSAGIVGPVCLCVSVCVRAGTIAKIKPTWSWVTGTGGGAAAHRLERGPLFRCRCRRHARTGVCATCAIRGALLCMLYGPAAAHRHQPPQTGAWGFDLCAAGGFERGINDNLGATSRHSVERRDVVGFACNANLQPRGLRAATATGPGSSVDVRTDVGRRHFQQEVGFPDVPALARGGGALRDGGRGVGGKGGGMRPSPEGGPGGWRGRDLLLSTPPPRPPPPPPRPPSPPPRPPPPPRRPPPPPPLLLWRGKGDQSASSGADGAVVEARLDCGVHGERRGGMRRPTAAFACIGVVVWIRGDARKRRWLRGGGRARERIAATTTAACSTGRAAAASATQDAWPRSCARPCPSQQTL